MARRHRITITIRDDLLHMLDRLIDHEQIRNRSHAVEVVLRRSLGHETRQAVILAGGAGVALRPFTYEIPKPLIPVKGRPILEHTIDLLKRHGIEDIILTVSHLKEVIIKHFEDGSRFGVRIRYVEETAPTGTGGALRAAARLVSSSPFLVLHGDILIDLDLTEFLNTHMETTGAIATIALTSAADPSEFGSVRLRGARVAAFEEKPKATPATSRLIFAGVLAGNRELFSHLPKKPHALSLERDVFPKLVAKRRLYGFPFEGHWFDVSTPKAYERALREWHIASRTGA
jgi:NDP-sugar pyrophosphorylase family protein